MEVVHVVSSIDNITGGPARSITGILQGMIDVCQVNAKLFTGVSSNPVIEILGRDDENLMFFNIGMLGRFKNLANSLIDRNNILLHGHGMWETPIHQMCGYARRNKISYVISPHGMLEPWALEQAKIKKNIALFLYQFSDLKNAFCIQATSALEAKNIRNLGLDNPIAVIPNGINLSVIKLKGKNAITDKRKLLFLSRIHHKKGIENLLLAWKKLPDKIKQNWTLEIVGDGDIVYLKTLKSRIDELGIENNVVIIGPLYDDNKNTAYQSADLFVLPTFSENFGMVVAEAMAYELPVITTKGAPWEELQTHNAGWWIDIGVEPLTRALMEAMSTPKSTLIEMGKNGRKLIEDKYSIESVAKQMTELYEWILNKREKPDFVI